MAGPAFSRKYNTLMVTGTTAIRIPMIKRAVVDFAVGADWTPAAGDVKIAIDGAAPANVTNLPTAVASGNGAYWEFILTAAETTGKQMIVTIVDSATKAVEDNAFLVETFGNASAMYLWDPTDGVHLGITALPNAAAGANNGLPLGDASGRVGLQAGTAAGQLDFTSGVVKSNLAQILGTALTETSGQIAAAFKKFFNIATPASTMDALTLVATATSLTNAPTAGDFTSTMKTSLNAATPASVQNIAAQTGDSYPIVSHATYGNAQLVRAATPANALAVSSTGQAGIDFNNIKDAAAPHTLTNVRVPNVTLTDTVTTYTGNTPQTGDSFPFADRTVGRGVVGSSAPSNTSFTPSSLTPGGTAADQFKGRIIIFDRNTTTAALQGQATDITASSAAALPLLTYTALTTAPQSGDSFSII